jgi:hypothetical protein
MAAGEYRTLRISALRQYYGSLQRVIYQLRRGAARCRNLS